MEHFFLDLSWLVASAADTPAPGSELLHMLRILLWITVLLVLFLIIRGRRPRK